MMNAHLATAIATLNDEIAAHAEQRDALQVLALSEDLSADEFGERVADAVTTLAQRMSDGINVNQSLADAVSEAFGDDTAGFKKWTINLIGQTIISRLVETANGR